ncbi:hypothetical protein LCGC14_2966360 [marine sediment metagenome]|uniref:Uncharacterized protein n=1 Tax=marine sediment metagenome TaxID=412755 RepID=A0A0F9A201_9ZZZZ
MDEKCENCKKLEDEFKILEKKHEDMVEAVRDMLQDVCSAEHDLQKASDGIAAKYSEFEDVWN